MNDAEEHIDNEMKLFPNEEEFKINDHFLTVEFLIFVTDVSTMFGQKKKNSH